MIEKPTNEEAQKFLDWFCELDPTWKGRIEALKEERHISALATLGTLAGWTLETGSHMEISVLPQFQDDYTPAGAEGICPNCEQIWTLAYPGQPFCSNRCADESRAKATELPPEPKRLGRPPLPRDEAGNIVHPPEAKYAKHAAQRQ